MDNSETSSIIAEICRGSEEAFKEFYHQNSTSLRYFAGKYIEQDDLIDDVVQDAFVRFWDNRKNFDSLNAAKAYLYKIVKNICLNIIRHNSVRNKYNEAISNEEDSESFLDNILESEIFDLLLKFFEELPPACKQVYRLSVSGMSHEEISRKLNITINTVKKHKNNANHFIRDQISRILSLLLFICT